MVSDDRDEMIVRLAAQLRSLPEVDPAARARLLVAVAAERERDRERQARRRWEPSRRSRIILAAAAVVAAVLVGREWSTHVTPAVSTAVAAAPVATRTAAVKPTLAGLDADADASAPRQVQLVFRAPAARHVSVVGDFSGWDPRRAVMTRDSGSGLWSVTLSLTPGRHVYAFLVDDSVWVRDPRAPAAPDADFGRPGSVLLVGRP